MVVSSSREGCILEVGKDGDCGVVSPSYCESLSRLPDWTRTIQDSVGRGLALARFDNVVASRSSGAS